MLTYLSVLEPNLRRWRVKGRMREWAWRRTEVLIRKEKERLLVKEMVSEVPLSLSKPAT
jgi:hypothetical protein